MNRARLGVNIDHVATLRQLRGTPYPDLLTSAQEAIKAGADQITVHLREDRRHIQDHDVRILKKNLTVPLNLEMAATSEMLQFALKVRPHAVCLVPEKRKELTTEGGLDVQRQRRLISHMVKFLKSKKIQVSCFIEPDVGAVEACHQLQLDAVELHTGKYCLLSQMGRKQVTAEYERIKQAVILGRSLGMQVHAGHGIDYQNVRKLTQLRMKNEVPLIEEYNIGHAIVCRSVLVGFYQAVREMKSLLS